jgi:hypothetical protein
MVFLLISIYENNNIFVSVSNAEADDDDDASSEMF